MSKRSLRQTTRFTETGRAAHTTLLYFVFNDELHFVEVTEAKDYLAMWQAKTWGEFRRAAPRLRATALAQYEARNEGVEEDDAVPLPADDDAFDIPEIPGASDGDWPRFPPFSILDWMPNAVRTRFGVMVSSVLNGPMLRLPAEREAAIVQHLEAAGYLCLRDDALADTLYG